MNIPALFSLLDSEPELVQRAVRLNNNFDQLFPKARSAAAQLGMLVRAL